MKVLFIGQGDYIDYMSDMAFHGLHELLGDDFYHSHPYGYMFSDFDPAPLRSMWGRGFTCYRLLDPSTKHVPEDLCGKIASRYFDYIVYGQVWRCRDHLDLVRDYYPQGKVAYLDGEDHLPLFEPETLYPYFKRELPGEVPPQVLPLSFAIPKERIVAEIPHKTRLLSPVIPGEPYSYDTEEPYYQQYRDSAYAKTWKKGGWDCLRHLEIMANGCVPLFRDIDDCPPATMTSYPKDLFAKANRLYPDQHGEEYLDLLYDTVDHLRAHQTTESLAKYILETLKC